MSVNLNHDQQLFFIEKKDVNIYYLYDKSIGHSARFQNAKVIVFIIMVDEIKCLICRESAAIYVCKYLTDEGANLRIYDPKVTDKKIFR